MKAYICDQCKGQAPLASELQPIGWYNINKLADKYTYQQLHLCGPSCLSAYAANELPQQEAAPPPTPDYAAPDLQVPTEMDEVRRG